MLDRGSSYRIVVGAVCLVALLRGHSALGKDFIQLCETGTATEVQKPAGAGAATAPVNAQNRTPDLEPASKLKLKGFHLGMTIEDALKQVNERMGLPQADPSAVTVDSIKSARDLPRWVAATKEDQPPFRIFRIDGKLIITRNPGTRPFALADDSGNVSQFEFAPAMTDKLFGAADMTAREFVRMFVEAYGTAQMPPEQRNLEARGHLVGSQTVYILRSRDGYEVSYYGEPDCIEPAMRYLAELPGRTLMVRKIATADQRKKAFD